jgi:hypothetical protein
VAVVLASAGAFVAHAADPINQRAARPVELVFSKLLEVDKVDLVISGYGRVTAAYLAGHCRPLTAMIRCLHAERGA